MLFSQVYDQRVLTSNPEICTTDDGKLVVVFYCSNFKLTGRGVGGKTKTKVKRKLKFADTSGNESR